MDTRHMRRAAEKAAKVQQARDEIGKAEEKGRDLIETARRQAAGLKKQTQAEADHIAAIYADKYQHLLTTGWSPADLAACGCEPPGKRILRQRSQDEKNTGVHTGSLASNSDKQTGL